MKSEDLKNKLFTILQNHFQSENGTNLSTKPEEADGWRLFFATKDRAADIVSSEIVAVAEDFSEIETTIDEIRENKDLEVVFSTKDISKKAKKLKYDCAQLADLVGDRHFDSIASDLTCVSQKLADIEFRLSRLHRRKPRSDELRNSQIRELATQIILILDNYGIEIRASARKVYQQSSIAVKVIRAVFEPVFDRNHCETESIRNLISLVQKERKGQFRDSLGAIPGLTKEDKKEIFRDYFKNEKRNKSN